VATKGISANNILEQIMRSSNARIISMEPEFIVIEKTGKQDEISELLEQLSIYDVREFIQSGRVIVTKPMGKLSDILRDLENQEE
jgi:acetolactate synthase-1/3 small subunit